MLPPPKMDLCSVFTEIKSMQKDNLSELPIEAKEQQVEDEVKGLKFVARKLKILLQKNRSLEYNDVSRILISNFATAAKDERNIKRRVYDAINVLVAAGVVTKSNGKIELKTFNSKAISKEKSEPIMSQAEINEKTKQKQIQVNSLRSRTKFLTNLINRKSGKKQQNIIMNPYLMICEGNINDVKFTKQKKKTIIQIKGAEIAVKPAPLMNFILKLEQKQP